MIHRSAPGWLATPLLAVACISLARPSTAQDIPKGREIHLHLVGSRTHPDGSNPYRILKVLPTDKGVCRGKGNQQDDCFEEVAWVLKGPGLPAGWQVEVRLKESGAKKCFPAAPFTLRSDDPVPSGPIDDEVCDRFDVWPYDVVLLDGDGKEKGRVDPLVVINY